MIILDIKSENEFENHNIITIPDPDLETIFSHTILHLPPRLIVVIGPHIESYIKNLFKAILDSDIAKSHPVTATVSIATPPVNQIQVIQAPPVDASAYTTDTSDQASSSTTNISTPTSTVKPNQNIN